MKAKLIFNLPDENIDFLRATKSLDLALALWDIHQLLYKDENPTKEEILEIYEKYNISLEEIIE